MIWVEFQEREGISSKGNCKSMVGEGVESTQAQGKSKGSNVPRTYAAIVS